MEESNFVIPKREVLAVSDMEKWKSSLAYKEYLGFVVALNNSIKGRKNMDSLPDCHVIDTLVCLFDKLDSWIDEIPPVEQPQRYGNKAFRTWEQRLRENSSLLLREFLSEQFHGAIKEIEVYMVESFGNSTRIDYGTGHEMSFVMFLACLFRIKALSESDMIPSVTRLFHRYLKLVRKLQLVYRMEPAGSHGVWSLDDFQFLPFLWGSSQLLGQELIEPSHLTDPELAAKYADDYLFFSCIQFIYQVKTGPFAEHSNQLWNISAVPSWHKVNQGLLKMYKAEVLDKFPVIQHTLFGSIFSIEPPGHKS